MSSKPVAVLAQQLHVAVTETMQPDRVTIWLRTWRPSPPRGETLPEQWS
jgi:hypothetical protein